MGDSERLSLRLETALLDVAAMRAENRRLRARNKILTVTLARLGYAAAEHPDDSASTR